MSCSCNANQTPKASFDARDVNRDSLGTGLFMVPAPEIGMLEYRGVVVPGITYSACVKRGENCIGFKWIADALMTVDQINAERANRSCLSPNCLPGFPCTDMTCICIGGDCYKV